VVTYYELSGEFVAMIIYGSFEVVHYTTCSQSSRLHGQVFVGIALRRMFNGW
jgi:hypothetical protein